MEITNIKVLEEALETLKNMDTASLIQIYKSSGYLDNFICEDLVLNSLEINYKEITAHYYSKNIQDNFDGSNFPGYFHIKWDGENFSGDY